MNEVTNEQQHKVAIDLREGMNSLAGRISMVLSEAVSLMKHNPQSGQVQKRHSN